MLSDEKCLEIIKNAMPLTKINNVNFEFQKKTLQRIAQDLGIKSSKHRDKILQSFPRYFLKYLQKNKLLKFIPQNDDPLMDDIEIIINFTDEEQQEKSESPELHKMIKEQKDQKKKCIIIEQQEILQSEFENQEQQLNAQSEKKLQQQPAITTTTNPLLLSPSLHTNTYTQPTYQQQIFQFQNPQFLIVNPIPDQQLQSNNLNDKKTPIQPQFFPLNQLQSSNIKTATLLPPTPIIQVCSKCNKQKPPPYLKFTNTVNYCQSCILQIMNPLTEIVSFVKEQYFVTKDGRLEFEYQDLDFTVSQQLVNQCLLEVRCVLPQQLQEITFPHNCVVKVNDKEIKTFKSLQIKSCLHKRKDNPILYRLKDTSNRISIQQMRGENQHRLDDPGQANSIDLCCYILTSLYLQNQTIQIYNNIYISIIKELNTCLDYLLLKNSSLNKQQRNFLNNREFLDQSISSKRQNYIKSIFIFIFQYCHYFKEQSHLRK